MHMGNAFNNVRVERFGFYWLPGTITWANTHCREQTTEKGTRILHRRYMTTHNPHKKITFQTPGLYGVF